MFALPMFTGCDTVSSFTGEGMRSARETWKVNSEVTTVFSILMKPPQQSHIDDVMDTIERFVVLMFDKTSSCSHVNEARIHLFAQKG